MCTDGPQCNVQHKFTRARQKSTTPFNQTEGGWLSCFGFLISHFLFYFVELTLICHFLSLSSSCLFSCIQLCIVRLSLLLVFHHRFRFCSPSHFGLFFAFALTVFSCILFFAFSDASHFLTALTFYWHWLILRLLPAFHSICS